MTSFTSDDLKRIVQNGIIDTFPQEAEIWRDEARNALIVMLPGVRAAFNGNGPRECLGTVSDACELLDRLQITYQPTSLVIA
jgi:hypothetical protein